ncbi:alginate export family protein [Brytella acorum]|uniref:Alginate export family protein n=1 Tax=Brytella acorum TaxID=2959299 RepID=A0AA35VFB5_9PROT|nr:alginate export family protein [Brytella acorum]MDF3626048.1 alginate export family protein [Brytella acorum]CAI9122149.1 alginate export family protein [Brytella acorum]
MNRIFLIAFLLSVVTSALATPRPEEEARKKASETLWVIRSRASIQNQPHAGVVAQPRRVTSEQNRPPYGHQGPWGAFTRGNGEAAGFGPVGRYAEAPWAEDWSNLRDPSHRDDIFDPLKFIALNNARSIWLSLSGETRLRNWYEQNPFLRTRSPSGSGRFGVRNLYGADLHLGEHIRVFGQLINADAGGWGGYGYNATFRKRLDLQQAFIEGRGRLLGAQSGIMLGRQEFLDAPSYILYMRNTPNVPLSWNGVRGYAIWPRIRVDLYDFIGTDINDARMFHNALDWTTRLHGLDVTIAPPDIRIGSQTLATYLDLFAIAFRIKGSSAALAYRNATIAGSTNRQNGGFRWYGSAPSFEFSVGGLYQGGTFENRATSLRRPVRAYAVNTIAGYRNPGSRWHPFLGMQADIYSGGDATTRSGTVGTYITPFNPQTNYLDTTTYIAPSNLVSLSPVLRTTPLPFLSLQFKAPFMWRETTRDEVYSSSGRYTFSLPGGGHYIGVIPQASLTLQLGRHLSWTQYGARVFASSGMRRAGARSGSYYQSNLVFRF